MPGLEFADVELAELEAAGRRRSLRSVSTAQGRMVVVDRREVLNFSSNNYLGFAGSRWLAAAVADGLTTDGVGSGASRLVVGNHIEHEALEAELAAFHRVGGARLFNTGYAANTGILPVLAQRDDAVFSDALNHASIVDGCRLSRAAVAVYPHRDLAVLGRLLAASTARRRVIVSETVFSMDGDRCDAVELWRLAQRFDAVLVLDEAHAVGAVGADGRGVAAESGVVPDVLVGTLGKAFGSFGAYVASSHGFCELLVTRCRPFVFSTGMPPAIARGGRFAVARAQSPEGRELRAALAGNIARLAAGLDSRGLLRDGSGTTSVFPVVVGDDRRVMDCTAQLLELGVYVQGIRPPTVPPGTARLRISLMATHTADDIDQLLAGLDDLRTNGLL